MDRVHEDTGGRGSGSASARDLIALSRTVAHALRHEPGRYGLRLDPEGWASLADLVAGLRAANRRWRRLDVAEVRALVGGSPRFELDGDRVRARYGHSVAARITRPRVEPPPTLFHGTTPAAAEAVLREGLAPMRRQHVHLSPDVATALAVGRRRTADPVVLVVDAAAAAAAGVTFYQGGERVWLADPIPPPFLRRWPEDPAP